MSNLTTAEQFLMFVNGINADDERRARINDAVKARTGASLEEIETAFGPLDLDAIEWRLDADEGYPEVQDAGECLNMPDGRTTAELFAEAVDKAGVFKFNPFVDADGWEPLFK